MKQSLIIVILILLLPTVRFDSYALRKYDIVAYYIQRNEIHVAYLVGEELKDIVLPMKKVKCPRSKIGHLIIKEVEGLVVDYAIKE